MTRCMESVYLNWAATSYRKPAVTLQAVNDYLQANHYQNSNRTLPGMAENGIAFQTRQTLADFFGVNDPAQVLFTQNATMSLNMVLNGLLHRGDHVLTTSMEHNAVTRPLNLLAQQGIETTYLACTKTGQLQPEQLTAALRTTTKALVMTHASNVTGTIMPIRECFALAKQHGLITILDASQTAGVLPINMADLNIDILIFTGHKSLLGLPGTGGFCLADGLAEQIEPWIVGGTGNASASLTQPDFLPDKFEPGTPNTLGILSLGTSVKAIEHLGLAKIARHEQALTAYFLAGLARLPVTVLGPQRADQMVPVISIVAPGFDVGELGGQLYQQFGVITRCGLHCAPLAHQTIGTFPTGSIRFSFGYQTTMAELDYTLTALAQLLKGRAEWKNF